jgi:hypothetical protein
MLGIRNNGVLKILEIVIIYHGLGCQIPPEGSLRMRLAEFLMKENVNLLAESTGSHFLMVNNVRLR